MASTSSTNAIAITGAVVGAAIMLSVLLSTGTVPVISHQVPAGPVGTTFMPQLDGVREKSYSSLAQVAAEADLVLVGRATGSRSLETVETIAFTVTEVDAVQVWKGALQMPARLKVRQLGASTKPGDVPLLVPDETYVLFLKRFTFGPGQETDQFVVVGVGSGLYRLIGPEAHRVDQESLDLDRKSVV